MPKEYDFSMEERILEELLTDANIFVTLRGSNGVICLDAILENYVFTKPSLTGLGHLDLELRSNGAPRAYKAIGAKDGMESPATRGD